MARHGSRKPTVDLSTAKRKPPTPRRVLGLFTVLIACAIGVGLAWLVHAGMTYEFAAYPTILHYIFFGLAVPGMIAGALAEGSGHGAQFEFHTLGNTVALAVNGLIYAAIMVLCLVLARPRRYKQ
jgi:hypothetical protein